MNSTEFRLINTSSEPLHAQISSQLRSRILSGDVVDNESLPSIRALARELEVSVITVQRAYDDLEHAGLIYARRGRGFYVAAISTEDRRAIAEERLTSELASAIDLAVAEGLDPQRVGEVFVDLFRQRSSGR